jgi:hypothetical protein
MGLRGSVFTTSEELEFVAGELLSSRRRKNEERSNQPIKTCFHDELAVASHPAQAQLAGPAQVKVYKTPCSDKALQPNEFTYVHEWP